MSTRHRNTWGETDRPGNADLRVEVNASPEPGLLRPAIEAAIAGRPWPTGPEASVAEAVVAHLAHTDHGGTELW